VAVSNTGHQLALQYAHNGNMEAARAVLEQLLAENACDAQGWFLLAAVHGQTGDMQAAITCSRRAIELDADCVDAYFNLAQAHMHLREYREARAAYEQLLVRQPRHTVALSNLGYLLNEQGEYRSAIECLEQARQLLPADAAILNHLGNAYSGLVQNGRAIECYAQAVRLAPGMAEAWNNLAVAYRRAGRYQHALDGFDKVLAVAPDHIDALVNKGLVLQLCGQAEQADAWIGKALGLAPDQPWVISAYLYNLNYFHTTPEPVASAHLRLAQRYLEHAPAASVSAGLPAKEECLRIGFVSPDFREHSVAYFFTALCHGHDPARMKLYCYADVARPDAMTESIRESVHDWRDINGLSPQEAERLIRQDRLDIVVDLAGHTESRMMEIFAGRVAPVQVTWLGYPNTTGLATMDYRITDAWADPVGESERYHSEQLVRLSGGFLCYQPPARMPDVAPLPAARTGQVTFGSFNNLAKLTPPLIALWSRLLHQVPGARLLLKNHALADVTVREQLYELFLAHGIGRERLEFAGFVPRNVHPEWYGRVDIALDSFPYNGTTTTCEALWMGVPVISLAGRTHAGRVGVSLLHQAGLADWIAADRDEFIDIAVRKSSDLVALKRLRAGLREQVRASALCDVRAFSAQMERAMRGLINRGEQRNA